MRVFPIVLGAMLLGAIPAFAQTVAAPPSPFTLNLTDIIVAAIGVVGSTILALGTYLINQKISDQQARDAFNLQLKASLGALQQAASGVVVSVNPTLAVPGVPANLQPAAQFMLDHAGGEMKQLGIDGPMLASHIVAAIGSKEIDANIAVAAKNGAVVAPLIPVIPIAAPPLVPLVPLSPILAPSPPATSA